MRPTNDRKKLSTAAKLDPNVYALCERITATLDRMANELKGYFIQQGNRTPTHEEVKAHLEAAFAPDRANQNMMHLLGFAREFQDQIETGNRQYKGARYADTTVKAYRSFLHKLEAFQEARNKVYTLNQIDHAFYVSFTAFLSVDLGNNPNTIGKEIKTLKTILRTAQELGIHDFGGYKTFHVPKLKLDPVVLTREELGKLEQLDLGDNLNWEKVRDLFLVGCYTAQRISDYGRISRDFIIEDEGRQYIEIRQKKVSETVLIPIKPELMAILKKYDFQVPDITGQHLNREIKKIAARAGIDSPVQIENYTNGGKKYFSSELKFNHITSHTARRTGATQMIEAGIPKAWVMSITGHRTEGQFDRYIGKDKRETFKLVADHPYFSGKLVS